MKSFKKAAISIILVLGSSFSSVGRAEEQAFAGVCNEMVATIADQTYTVSDYSQQVLLNIFEKCLSEGPKTDWNAQAYMRRAERNSRIDQLRRFQTASKYTDAVSYERMLRTRYRRDGDQTPLEINESIKTALALAEIAKEIFSEREVVVMLGIFMEVDKDEIARHLKVKKAAVYKSYERSQEKLRELISLPASESILEPDKESWATVIGRAAFFGVIAMTLILLLRAAGALLSFVGGLFRSEEEFQTKVQETVHETTESVHITARN